MAGPGGVEVGRASIRVLPDLSAFGRSLGAYVQRIERQVVIQVPTVLDTKGLAAEMVAAKAKLEQTVVRVAANVESITGEVAAEVQRATRTAPAVKIKTDVDRGGMSALTTVTGQLQTTVAGVGAGLIKWGPLLLAGGAAAVAVAPSIAVLAPAAAGASLAVGTLALGLQGLGDAIAASSDPKKFSEAMKGLSGEARKTVQTIVGLKPAFADLRTAVQDSLLRGVGPAIKQVATTFLPVLKTEMTAVAAGLNQGAKNFAAFVTSGPGLALIKDNLSGARAALAPLGGALKPLTTALLQLGVAAGPALKLVSQGIAGAATSFAEFIARTSEAGTLQTTIVSAVKAVGALLGGIGAVLGPLTKGLAAVGPGVITALSAALSGVGAVISALVANAPRLGPMFAGLVTVVAPLSTAFRGLVAAALPVAQQVFTVLATTGGPLLAGVFRAIVGALTPVITGFQQFVAVVGPQLGPTIQAVVGFVQGLLPTLQELGAKLGATVGRGLAEIGQVISTTVLPGFRAILPVIQPVAKFLINILGGAVIGAVNGAINVIKGVLKVIGGLLQFVAAVFTGQWGKAWTAVKTIFSGAFDAIKGIVQVVWNVGIVKLLGTGLTAIKAIFTGGVAALKALGARLMAGLKGGIEAGWKTALAFVKTIPGLIVKGFGAYQTLLRNVGSQIVSGLVAGLRASADAVVGAAMALVDKIPESIRKLLRISSPSKVMIEIARFVGDGLRVGLLGSRDQVAAAAESLTRKITDAVGSLAQKRTGIQAQIAKDAAAVKAAQKAYAVAVRDAGASGAAAVARAGLALKQAQEKLTRDQASGAKGSVLATDRAAIERAKLRYEQSVAAQGKAAQKAITTARDKLAAAVARLANDKKALSDLDASFLGLAKGSAQARLQSLVASANAQLSALADRREALADQLKTAQESLTAALQVRDDYAKQLRDAVVAYGDVTKAASAASGAVTAKNILKGLRSQLAAIVSYRQNIEALRAGGLSDAALQQILAAGVEGGSATAAGIARGGAEAIAAVNQLTAQIGAEAAGLGTGAARWFFQGGVDAAQGLVSGLQQQQAAVEAQAQALVAGILAQIRRILGIAADPKAGGQSATYTIGTAIGQGLAAGIDSSTSLVQAATRRLAAAAAVGSIAGPTLTGAGPVGTSITNHFVVNNPAPETVSTSATRTTRALALRLGL